MFSKRKIRQEFFLSTLSMLAQRRCIRPPIQSKNLAQAGTVPVIRLNIQYDHCFRPKSIFL